MHVGLVKQRRRIVVVVIGLFAQILNVDGMCIIVGHVIKAARVRIVDIRHVGVIILKIVQDAIVVYIIKRRQPVLYVMAIIIVMFRMVIGIALVVKHIQHILILYVVMVRMIWMKRVILFITSAAIG